MSLIPPVGPVPFIPPPAAPAAQPKPPAAINETTSRFGEPVNTLPYQDRLFDAEYAINIVRQRLEAARDTLRINTNDQYYPYEQMRWGIRVLEETAYDLRRLAADYQNNILA